MKVGYSFEGLVNRVTAVDESAVHKTGDETVAGLKTFTSCPASSGVQGTAGTHLTRRDFVLAELNKKVDLTGAQTIGGAKTFSNNLTAPAFLSSAVQNTAVNAATRKDYVDAGLAEKLNLSGDTMTGNLFAPAVLVSSAQNASGNALTRKDYVDAQVATRAPTTHTHTAAQGNADVVAGSYQNIGAYVLAANISAAKTSHGQTTAGSALRPTSCWEFGPAATSLPGTWRCMGDITKGNDDGNYDDRTTLYMRVA